MPSLKKVLKMTQKLTQWCVNIAICCVSIVLTNKCVYTNINRWIIWLKFCINQYVIVVIIIIVMLNFEI
jgi:hypothetical protein